MRNGSGTCSSNWNGKLELEVLDIDIICSTGTLVKHIINIQHFQLSVVYFLNFGSRNIILDYVKFSCIYIILFPILTFIFFGGDGFDRSL